MATPKPVPRWAIITGIVAAGLIALVLILDANNRIAQVNLSYVVPGATVARTVAWAPRELAEWNNAFHLDGSRVQLKLKSTFTDVNDKHERLKLSWNVDVDLAVAPAK